ncbi:MAG: beta-N-acetylhexosaminidase [Lachnospiraceae bacterium]
MGEEQEKQGGWEERLPVIPKVRRAEGTGRQIPVPKALFIGDAFDPGAREVFAGWCQKIGIFVTVGEGGISLVRVRTEEEGYVLRIREDGILVTAAPSGERAALATLFQLLAAGELRELSIEDAPTYSIRSFSLDVSRHFFPKEEILRLLDQAALVKLNRFHFHVSDDQGYRLPSSAFPLLNEKTPVHYTKEEIQEIVRAAGLRGITIVPEIDIPGHSLAITAAYPWLSCDGEKQVRAAGGIEKRILCGGSERTRAFLKALLDEVCDLFPGSPIHLGGDEAPKDHWKICPACQKRIQDRALSGEEALQAELLNDLASHLQSRGREAICWNEAAVSGELSDQITLQYWDELHPDPGILGEVQKGRKFILSNLQNWYADYGYGLEPLRAAYDYIPGLLGQHPFDREQVQGMELTMWTEWVKDEAFLEKLLFPRLAAAAETMWAAERSYPGFCTRLVPYEAMLDRFAISHVEGDGSRTTSEEQAKEIVQDAVRMHLVTREMPKETAISHLAGWVTYLEGTWIPEEVRNLALDLVRKDQF